MKKIFSPAAVLMGLLLILTGCPNPFQAMDGAASGSLSIQINEELSRTIAPSISMRPASYKVAGIGPDEASFSESTDGKQCQINALAFGEWSITVTAFNENDVAIGQGTGTTVVRSNQTMSLDIRVVPYEGFGRLDLSLDWNEGDLDVPAVTASLLPFSGTARDLAFTVNGSAATFSADDVASGYHTLTVQLEDNGALVMGAVEVLRIVKDQTSSGSFVFDKINQPGGKLQINIAADMKDPLELSIKGAQPVKPGAESLNLSAVLSNYHGNVSYVWYVNGASKAVGKEFTLDNTWAKGFYNIGLTAFNTDGSRAGSSDVFIEVQEGGIVSKDFVTVWSVGVMGDKQIKLPLLETGIKNFAVDWGDGSTDTISSWDDPAATHSYADYGTYEVRISGELSGWGFPDPSGSDDAKRLSEITQWGCFRFADGQDHFRNCTYLKISAQDLPDLSGATSFSHSFHHCEAMTSIPRINEWDTGNIRDMASMFSSSYSFDGDISAWNTKNVTDMSGMFAYAHSFSGDISDWDTGNVRDMEGMLFNANSLSCDLSNWNTGNVTNMSRMFGENMTFNGNLCAWNTENVTNMAHMFYHAIAFNGNLSTWDTGNVTNMEGMFYDAGSFNQNLSDWDITSVSKMMGMFENSGLSTSNYDAVLIAWEAQAVQNDVILGARGIQYSDVGAAARQRLIDDHNWTIRDAGLAP